MHDSVIARRLCYDAHVTRPDIPSTATADSKARLYPLVSALLFRLDPERAHDLALTACGFLEPLLRMAPAFAAAPTHPSLCQTICGMDFPNPIGLAAGFDKSARAPHVWPWLGFGFAELGTITWHAQPGNPPPRMFRLPLDRALINRLGFNNPGAEATARRIAGLLARPTGVPIGLNIGKSKTAALDAAVDDYRASFRALFRYADYVTINVSSPNTPGLRDLQAPAELARLLLALRGLSFELSQEFDCAPRPLFVKVAPDLDDDALARIVDVVLECEATGLIATNTTLARPNLRTSVDEAGGLSGAPLRDRANAVVRALRRRAGAAMPIIGVGGIFSAEDAYERIRAGADLVQIYSAMVFEGPFLSRRIVRGLVRLLERDSHSHISQVVGLDA